MKKMDRIKVGAMVFCLGLGVLTALSSAKADEWNRKTVMTFSQPFEVPGVGAQILPAGTYVFKIMDLPDRDVVQIFNQAEDHVFTTILAIPNYRLKTTDKTVMTFRERGEGQPEAIRAWFYPGRSWGEEFVYPKARALELAKIVDQPVLATPVDLPAPVEALKVAPIVAVKPTGEEVAVAEVVQAPPAEVASNEPAPAEPAAAELPQTASQLPLVGLVGLLSLGGCFGLFYLSKRIA
jgi:LPXTG-motif cell wall-anchored protein